MPSIVKTLKLVLLATALLAAVASAAPEGNSAKCGPCKNGCNESKKVKAEDAKRYKDKFPGAGADALYTLTIKDLDAKLSSCLDRCEAKFCSA